MIRWAPFPFLRITFFFCLGILAFLQANQYGVVAKYLAGFLMVMYAVLAGRARFLKSGHWYNLAGVAAMLLLFLAGYLLTYYRTLYYQPQNLNHPPQTISHYVGVVTDYITYKPNTVSTTLQVKSVKAAGHWQAAAGKVRLTVKRPPRPVPLSYGTVLMVKGQPQAVKPPFNPGQFDYRQYLKNSHIYYQHYLPAAQLRAIGYEPGNRLMALGIAWRNNLNARLRAAMPAEREYGVAAALLLGIKDYLPEDIKSAYAQSGTMHVLAVSGLHVGVLFYLLNILLGKWSRRRGVKWLRLLVLLGIFGMYAFVTALSASVLRAVGMFLLLVAAETFRRQTNIYNTLAVAAFLLLLYNPYFLVEVGFQLSFLAVLGIVYFSPKLENWWTPTSYAGRFLWKMSCASVAAQLTTLPLTLYYFDQFPVYFLAANLVAITVSSLALIVGLLVLAFSWWAAAALWLGQVVTWLLSFMHQSNTWWLQAPFPVIKSFTLTALQAALLYGMLTFIILFLTRKKLMYFIGFTGLVLIFSALKITAARNQLGKKFWVVYQIPGATALSFIEGYQARLLADSIFYAHPKHQQYTIQPHYQQAGLTNIYPDTLKPRRLPAAVPVVWLPDGNQLLQWHGQKILVVRQPVSAGLIRAMQPDFVILSHRPYLNLVALIPVLREITVLLDGSNGQRYAEQIEQKLTKAGITCYNLNRRGAWVQPVMRVK